ncbi:MULTISPECIES: branched-chain amino acid ABC transporter permease [Niallia]|uniref:Branched-chain amino acid ABC transporter permease n=1 Tax=Niallia circulans TaxID=1397 RepID=A0AA91TUN0_NIACI|nr:branched-chain amino acid ABC transporter permease [Niallia circulans]AYV74815.1 branched-chain amino acid ABC transporter permease [Niallia circulans]MED5099067.1 branched-chain amino acid ABC transporter permease [Niallia circulans]NRG26032.1 branched-chain amino acid ABC transporter permease [Niallia circulans]PAD84154.1 branched-chain amino acid ABC transporter permease [Niallia circulans]QJX64434.1 branched-chain amino acid ABC transporter permease [Niallia circulans]
MKNSKAFWIFLILSALIYGVIQFLMTGGWIDTLYSNMIILMAINIMLAVSLHLVIGITGQFSIGHAGFLAVGAYVSAIATMKFQMPFPIAILAGGIVAALAGLLVGIPTLRLRGDYLAIATLGFAEIIRIFFLNIDYVGGAAGMQITHLTTWTSTFICLFITILVIVNFTNSRHGRAAIAIRENEIAADAMGINTTYYKVAAFALGSLFAGVAGALQAHNFYIINPTNFGFLKSFDILIYVVLGGLGSLSGSVIAASFLTIISTYLQDYPETRMIIYSLVLVIVMLYRPKGLMGTKEITDLFKRKGGNSND